MGLGDVRFSRAKYASSQRRRAEADILGSASHRPPRRRGKFRGNKKAASPMGSPPGWQDPVRVRLELDATAERHRISDRRAVAIEELDDDDRVATHAAAGRLL